MQTRIRFQYDDGEKGKNRKNSTTAISKQNFEVNGRQVRLFLHLKDFYFELIDSEGIVVDKGGNATNTAVLLRQAKRRLKELGCEFESEKRIKGQATDERPKLSESQTDSTTVV